MAGCALHTTLIFRDERLQSSRSTKIIQDTDGRKMDGVLAQAVAGGALHTKTILRDERLQRLLKMPLYALHPRHPYPGTYTLLTPRTSTVVV